MNSMHLYSYDGPVKEYDDIISNRWQATTYAVSEKKARSNLVYRYKKDHKKTPNASIKLPGKITQVS